MRGVSKAAKNTLNKNPFQNKNVKYSGLMRIKNPKNTHVQALIILFSEKVHLKFFHPWQLAGLAGIIGCFGKYGA